MKAPEAELGVEEFCSLVEGQRRFIELLERSGNDVGSAKIILESLLVSLFLCINDTHRTRRYIQPGRPVLAAQTPATCTAGNRKSLQLKESAGELKSALILLFPRVVALRGGKIPMPKIVESKRQLDKAPIVPDFRPLTEEEQKEYMNSLSDESKRRLAELMGKKSLSEPAAVSHLRAVGSSRRI